MAKKKSKRGSFGNSPTGKVVPLHKGAGANEILAKALSPSHDGHALVAREFHAYAGPSTWGPWTQVASHLGVVTYKITAAPVGDTVLLCRVKYYKTEKNQVTEEFREDTTITTGNAVANVEVSFKGIPTGSAVDGTIDPWDY